MTSVVVESKKLAGQLAQLEKDIIKTAFNALKGAVQRGFNHAKASTLYEDRTGRLRAATKKATFYASGTMYMAGALRNDMPYARYVDKGRGPVYPVKAKALRFKGKNGKYVFRKRVGPARARPFFTNASRSAAGYLRSHAPEAVATVIREFNQKAT